MNRSRFVLKAVHQFRQRLLIESRAKIFPQQSLPKVSARRQLAGLPIEDEFGPVGQVGIKKKGNLTAQTESPVSVSFLTLSDITGERGENLGIPFDPPGEQVENLPGHDLFGEEVFFGQSSTNPRKIIQIVSAGKRNFARAKIPKRSANRSWTQVPIPLLCTRNSSCRKGSDNPFPNLGRTVRLILPNHSTRTKQSPAPKIVALAAHCFSYPDFAYDSLSVSGLPLNQSIRFTTSEHEIKTGGKERAENFIKISNELKLSSFFKLSNLTIQNLKSGVFFDDNYT